MQMQTYSTLLSDQLQLAICKKWWDLLQKGVIRQHDDFHHAAHLSDSRQEAQLKQGLADRTAKTAVSVAI